MNSNEFDGTVAGCKGGIILISIGIDVSKGKSKVCAINHFGEMLISPYDVYHTKSSLEILVQQIRFLNDECKVILEATGHYHYPMVAYLKENGIPVVIANPLLMKKFNDVTIRKGKSDKLDSIKIARFGLQYWISLRESIKENNIYEDLSLLSRQYLHYTRMLVTSKLSLLTILDQTMPSINEVFRLNAEISGKDKLRDFIEEFWHFDNITKMSEKKFILAFEKWTKKKGYRFSETKAKEVYALAMDGIPTLSSSTAATKQAVLESARVLKEIENTLTVILSQMRTLANGLKEYHILTSMPGIGDKLAVIFIAEIGDIRKFHSGKSLIGYAGIDSPPFESGKFEGTHRHISKRGNKHLRRTGYLIMKSIKSHHPMSDPVYEFMLKKEMEGKAKKVAMIAGFNKFLRIYYAQVKEAYQS
jgi:transposase